MRCIVPIVAILMLQPRLMRAQADAATESVRRLGPSAFSRLPIEVRSDLEMRGCRIPQPWGDRVPKNVIAGAFTAARVREWAILCSVRDTSQILIYRLATRRPPQVVDSLLPAADGAWMQGIGGDRLGFSRLLRTMPLRYIRHWRHDIDGHAIPQPVDHDAIEQVIVGKAAEAFYYASGRIYRHVTAD